MQRVTITLDDELLEHVDAFSAERGYDNRSEAIRDLVRNGLQQREDEQVDGRHCVAALVYVYDHAARELSRRLTRQFHDHHDLAVSNLHVHLDHESCLEVAVLRGPVKSVREFGAQVVAERGVAYGRLVMVPVEVRNETHVHGTSVPYAHAHTRIRS